MLTSEQIRAARALLRWEQKQLADASGVSVETIRRLEKKSGLVSAYTGTVAKIKTALEEGGVEFINGNGSGVCLSKQQGFPHR